MKKALLSITIISCSILSFSQTGPGGVDSTDVSSNLELWLRADSISGLANGASLSMSDLWPDASGNDRDASIDGGITLVGSLGFPSYNSSDANFNNQPSVTFDISSSEGLINAYSYNARTVFVVFNGVDDDTQFGQLFGDYDNDFHVAIDARAGNELGFSFDGNGSSQAIYGLDGAVYTGAIANSNTQSWTGGTAHIVTTEFTTDETIVNQVIGSLEPNRDDFNLNGDIAEIIVYDRVLNDAERIAVENYLSSKYGITIANDFFTLESTHGNEIAGIGSVDGASVNEGANSSTVLRISDPQDVDAGEFVFFGHDNQSISSWVTTEIPNSVSSIQRIGREWQLEETGDLGTATFTIDTTNFEIRPEGHTKFVLLVDDDGNFSDATIYELTGSDNLVSVSLDLDLSSTPYISVGAIIPELQFTSTTANELENTTANIAVELNYISASNIDFEYDTEDISATSPADYTAVVDGAGTITAGLQTTTISVTLLEVAGDVAFAVKLSNPNPPEALLGPQDSLTFIINDDDLTNEVSFVSTSSSGSEAEDVVPVSVTLSEVDNSNDIEIYYSVTGGSATNGTDYDGIDIDTVTVVSGATQSVFFLSIIDDAFEEANETIVIDIIGASNAMVGSSDTQFTYTILNNDNVPEVQFSTTSGSGDENISPITLTIELSATSLSDITIDYEVSGTSTESADHSLSNGSIVVGSGSLSGTISLSIIDDSDSEVSETVIVDLVPSSSYDLTADSLYTYTIIDNDPFGTTGPAGVGDGSINELWLRADQISGVTNGSELTISDVWPDASGNDRDAFIDAGISLTGTLDYPSYNSSDANFNSMPSVTFTGSEDDGLINDYSYEGRTIFAVFNVADNQFGQLWGNYEDFVQVAADTRSDFDGFSFDGNTGPTTAIYGLDGNDYTATPELDDNTQQFTIGTTSIVSVQLTGNQSISNQVIGTLEPNRDDFNLDGEIAELIVYNTTLDDTRRNIIENYLSSKYGVTLADDDLYSLEGTGHENDVSGIGQESSIDFHLESQSSGILSIGNPSDLDDLEYLFFGHDGGDTTSWSTINIPDASFQTLARVWRVDITGNVGTVDVTIDTQNLPDLPTGFSDYYLFIDDDNDLSNGFASETLLAVSGTDMVASGISIDDGGYVSIGIRNDVLINFYTTSQGLGEDSGAPEITVILSQEPTSTVTVEFIVKSATATEGVPPSDFQLSSSPLTFVAGDSVETITLTINDDAEVELDENLVIALRNATVGAVGVDSVATITINDNDNDGFTGPGGVGGATNNVLWVSADSVTTASGEPADMADVTSWVDLSGNDNHIFANVNGHDDPVYEENAINGLPTISFDGNDALDGPSVLSGNTGRTLFFVAKADVVTVGSTATYMFDLEKVRPSSGTGYLVTPEVGVRVSGNRIYNESFGTSDYRLLTVSNATGVNAASIESYLEGVQLTQSTLADATLNTGSTGIKLGGLTTGASFEGDISEIIVFDQELNEARRIIIENYLHTKYGLTNALTNDVYAHDGTHPFDLVGIGRTGSSSFHNATQSASLVTLSNSSSLDDDDFLLFGHNNGDTATWVTTETPGDSIYRIAREWRFDETGDVGTVTLTLDTANLPDPPAGFTEWVLWLDNDGDFSTEATQIPLIKGSGSSYVSENTEISDGDFLSFGVFKPVVQFNDQILIASESVTSVSFDLSLNYALAKDLTIEYDTLLASSDETDHDFVDGIITFTAGSTLQSISGTIIDDMVEELTDTLLIELNTISIGGIGVNDTLMFIINDDDNTTSMDFAVSSSSGTESNTPASITFRINEISISDASVEYSVTGGTASGSGIDYTLAAGTATVTAGNLTTTIPIDINDDAIGESNETIEITLSNPTNASLGSNTVHTFTILDDDTSLEANFTLSATGASEDAGTVEIEISLNDVAASATTIDFSITGGTATGGGADYDILASQLVIGSGEQTGDISIIIVDDSDVEGGETVIIELTDADGAIIGSTNTMTFSISDNDNDGFTGPGGVGDATNNVLWIRSDSISAGSEPSDGAGLTEWIDLSGNGNDFALDTGSPTYVAGALNSLPVVRFDGDDGMNTVDMISGTLGRTIFYVAKQNASSGTSPFDVDPDESAYFLEFNEDRSGTTAQSYMLTTEPAVRVNGNIVYDQFLNLSDYRLMTFRSATGSIVTENEGYLEGLLLGASSSASGTETVNTLSGGTYIGGYGTSNATFEGDAAEVIVFGEEINDAQRIIIENYLHARYDLNNSLTNDFYSFQTLHPNDLAGIGRVDVDNQHYAASSGAVLTISSPSEMGDGDFLFFGHDGASATAWISSDVPDEDVNIQRLSREWRVDSDQSGDGSLGTLTLNVDAATLPAFTTDYDNVVLLIDSDGIFETGAQIVPLNDQGDGTYEAAGLSLADNSYLAIAILRQEIGFSLASSQAGEGDGPTSIVISTNRVSSEDITVSYDLTGGTAQVEDYSVTVPSTLIITAGNTSANLSVGIINDSEGESTETMIFTLDSPSGAVLGSIFTHTLSINDDDQNRTIDFASISASDDESQDSTAFIVQLNFVDNTNPTTVDYEVTSGTATGSNIDYLLASGTATVDATRSSDTVSFFINEDNLLEGNETIIVTLSNPTNAGLGSNDTFTYTINDNDVGPEIAFTSTSPASSESVTPASIEVSLSDFSGLDATVNYKVTGGTASGNGVDYTLGNGTLEITSGSLTANILPVIFDDTEIETGETIRISLLNPSGTSLGADSVAFFTINDNDNEGFTGPGGVGDDANNVLWIKADSVTTGATEPSDLDAMTVWVDASGNGNGFSLATGSPTYIADGLNGNPVIRFDGDDGMAAPDVISGNIGRTIFSVVMQNASTGTSPFVSDIDEASWFFEFNKDRSGSTANSYMLGVEPSVRVSGNIIYDTNPALLSYNLLTFSNAAGSTVENVSGYLNGSILGTSSTASGTETLSTNGGGTYVGGYGIANTTFDGDVAEVIAYNQELNEAQRIIVENYLSAKYDLTIANDYFLSSTYIHDVAGIGQANGTQHTSAQSSGILSLSSPSALDSDGEFAFIGHDDSSISNWTTNEAPNSGENIQRVAREWLVELTGTIGTVSVAIDATDLPALPSGFDTYYILVDSDGDFSTGSDSYVASSNGDGLYEASTVTINSGEFIAVAVVRPVIEFTEASSGEFEPDGPGTIGVSLNFPIGENVEVDYSVTGGTATGGGTDYTLNDGTAIITSGNTSTSFPLFLTNDTDGTESDETVIITLSDVGTDNATLGTQSIHTFTIQDDDNLRKIYFATDSIGDAENIGTNTSIINITASQVDPDNATTVDIAVAAESNATLGEDFTLSSTTVTIAANNTSSSDLMITIIDDNTAENNETIILEMSNPVNGNLADPDDNPIMYQFTIEDNDSQPEIEFGATSATVSEDGGTGQLILALSGRSGQDVTVDYTINGSSTASSGLDYTFSAGTATILAGDSTVNLNINLSNDTDIEGTETVIVDLTDNMGVSPMNAILGSNQQATLFITDDDNSGITGPGGVGDANNNVLWISADSVTSSSSEPANNADITNWIDISGNGNDIFQNVDGLDDPIYVESAINSLPVIRFDGNDALEGPSVLSGNVGRTVFLVTKANDVTLGSTGAYIIDLEKDRPGSGTGYLITTEVGVRVNGNRIYNQSLGTADFRLLTMRNASGVNAAQVEAYIEGTALTESTLSDATLNTGSSGVKIGGLTTGASFDGDIAEIIVYNTELNTAQRIVVENYLHAKYQLPNALSDDRFTENQGGSFYNNNIAGLGQAGGEAHTAAQSAGLLTIEGALSIDDDDFLLFGHDGGDIASWTTTESPDVTTIQRIEREWYVDETNDLGTLTIKLADASLLPARPVNYESYVLLFDTDGNFSSGASIYPLANTTGPEYEATGVDLMDGYITFAVIQNVTDGSNGDFSDAGTWTSGIVPAAGQSAIITDGDDVFLSEDVTIGQITINTGATLDLAGFNLTIDTDSIQLVGTGSLIANNGTITYSAAGAQNVSGGNYHHLVIDGGGTKTLLGSADIDGDLTINSTLDVSVANDYTINLAGNLDNNGVFNEQNGLIVLDGSSNQTFDGTFTLYDLQLSKGGGELVLNTSFEIGNELQLTSGNIVLGNFDLTIGDNGSITDASASSYIEADGVGTLIKSIDAVFGTHFNFEVGDATIYSPFYFRLNSATIGTNARVSLNLDNAVNGNLRTEASHLTRYWTIEPNDLSGSIDYDVAFIYDETDDLSGTETSLVPIKFSVDLDTTGYTATVDYNLDIAQDSIFWNGLTSFSEVTAGVDEDNSAILPVELLYVYARVMDEGVLVEWATATEINNDYFAVEKTQDFEQFETVALIDGAGNSNEVKSYQILDPAPYPGITYYRLRQTDFDGTSTMSEFVRIELDGSFTQEVKSKIYPIPFKLERGLNISLSNLIEGAELVVRIHSLDGKEVFTDSFYSGENGKIKEKLFMPSYSSRGDYILTMTHHEVVKSFRIVVK